MNIHIYPSVFLYNSNMLRQTDSLLEMGLVDSICVVSTWGAGLPEFEERKSNYHIIRLRLHFSKYSKNILTDTLKYLEFTYKVFQKYRKRKVRVVSCHSLFTLPIGVLLKKFGKADKLVYNAQELETEKCGLKKSVRHMSKILEKRLIGHVDKMTVVSPSIANWYSQEYDFPEIYLMRNVPRHYTLAKRSDYFRTRFTIPSTALIYIYQGGIGYGRGMDLLLDVFSNKECRQHLVIMGYGSYEDRVLEASALHDNIHFHPAVSPDELLEYTSCADVGLCMIENVCLSYYYCLPNKLFEYLHSGIPVVASNFPDLEEVVNEFDCGWTSPVNSESLSALVNRLTFSDLEKKIPGIESFRSQIHWDREKDVLNSVFK